MNKNYHKRFTYLFFAEIYSICSLSKIETWPKAWSCISSLVIWEWLWSKSFRRLSCYKYQNLSKVIFYHHVPPPKNNTKLLTSLKPNLLYKPNFQNGTHLKPAGMSLQLSSSIFKIKIVFMDSMEQVNWSNI